MLERESLLRLLKIDTRFKVTGMPGEVHKCSVWAIDPRDHGLGRCPDCGASVCASDTGCPECHRSFVE